MLRIFLSAGSLFACLAVILGAFGAHALKEKITLQQMQVFETGVKYQLIHALALIITGILYATLIQDKKVIYSGYLFIAGIVFFSFSLYLLSCNELLGITSWKWLGPVTPLGGLCFITAWILLAISCLNQPGIK